MKKKILPILILIRLITNDGIFLENRKPPNRTQPPEIRSAIKRTWKRGKKNVSIQSKEI